MSRSVEKRIYELNWLIPTRGVVGAGPIVAPGPAGRHADDQITSKKAEVGMEVETAGGRLNALCMLISRPEAESETGG